MMNGAVPILGQANTRLKPIMPEAAKHLIKQDLGNSRFLFFFSFFLNVFHEALSRLIIVTKSDRFLTSSALFFLFLLKIRHGAVFLPCGRRVIKKFACKSLTTSVSLELFLTTRRCCVAIHL